MISKEIEEYLSSSYPFAGHYIVKHECVHKLRILLLLTIKGAYVCQWDSRDIRHNAVLLMWYPDIPNEGNICLFDKHFYEHITTI